MLYVSYVINISIGIKDLVTVMMFKFTWFLRVLLAEIGFDLIFAEVFFEESVYYFQ